MTAELSKSVLKKAKAAHKKLFNRIGTQIDEFGVSKYMAIFLVTFVAMGLFVLVVSRFVR
jgi:hypothetical protein